MNAQVELLELNDGGHSPMGASSFGRRALCPASLQMEKGIKDTSSPAAQEGTAAHWVAEQSLLSGKPAIEFVMMTCPEAPEVEITVAICDSVQEYVDYVSALGGKLLIEERVDFSPWVPGGMGTADAIALDSHLGVMTVADLKFGKGVRVDAPDNWQPVLYALGALNDYGWLMDNLHTVRMVIHQPRLDHVSEWEITVDELLVWGRKAGEVAAQALSQDPPFNPSESACRWCKAKAVCKPLAQHNLKTAAQEFAGFGKPYDVREVETMDESEIAFCLSQADLLDTWTKNLRASAYSLLERGGELPGFKLVEGRSVRTWKDATAAEEALIAEIGTDCYAPRKLITAPQAEKILGKQHEILADHVVKPAGKPTLVPESDKRLALPSSAERDFATS